MEDETLLARDSLTLKPPLTKEMYIGESNADYYRNQVMIDFLSLFFVQKPIHEEYFFYCSLHKEGTSYRNHLVSGIIAG